MQQFGWAGQRPVLAAHFALSLAVRQLALVAAFQVPLTRPVPVPVPASVFLGEAQVQQNLALVRLRVAVVAVQAVSAVGEVPFALALWLQHLPQFPCLRVLLIE
tara:strand:+ start:1222 stop:1533 length:312 start_codon:yes stop_codon:yes gene_type:complete